VNEQADARNHYPETANSLGCVGHLRSTCNSNLFSESDSLSGHFPEVPWWVCWLFTTKSGNHIFFLL